MTAQGYCGSNYDRFVENTNTSTLHKMKETYWTTKQAVIKKLGKKEDEHVVASDSQLDAKLELKGDKTEDDKVLKKKSLKKKSEDADKLLNGYELSFGTSLAKVGWLGAENNSTAQTVFKAIQKSSMDLLRVIERYQDRLCAVAQEENATGRFLKSHCSHDKTRAGKMMAAVGKSQSFSAQQRLALRVPLVRLYQEVETFRYRAISDTLVTVNRMEGARTEYRGALLWMKNVSEELDPDTYKQLEKFRKVQAQVRKTKQRFDKLKLDVMQKVDLLAASRCNMFSHVLANYQSTLLHFWKKTSRTMSAVAESFKGYQYYEFNMLKELTDTSRKLAEDTNGTGSVGKEDSSDTELVSDEELIDVSEERKEEENEEDLYREFEERQRRKRYTSDYMEPEVDRESLKCSRNQDMADVLQPEPATHFDPFATQDLLSDLILPMEPRLLAIDDSEETYRDDPNEGQKETKTPSEGQSEGDFGPYMDFHDDEDTMKQLEEELEKAEKIMGSVKAKSAAEQQKQPPGGKDLLAPTQEQDDADKDDLELLNEILNAPSTGEDEFTQEWQAVFGANVNLTPDAMQAEKDPSRRQAEFMPSSLLDTQMSALNLGKSDDLSNLDLMASAMANSAPQTPQASAQSSAAPTSKQQQPPKKGQKADMSAWFNLFADLDPLSNPDAVGREAGDMIGEL